MTKKQDPIGKGIARTIILENEATYTYYKRHRTAGKPVKQQIGKKRVQIRPVITAAQDERRGRQPEIEQRRTRQPAPSC